MNLRVHRLVLCLVYYDYDLLMVLIFISLMTSNVKHLLLNRLAFHVSSLEKYQVLCPLFNWVIIIIFAIELYEFFTYFEY